jgi:hypothetical protein
MFPLFTIRQLTPKRHNKTFMMYTHFTHFTHFTDVNRFTWIHICTHCSPKAYYAPHPAILRCFEKKLFLAFPPKLLVIEIEKVMPHTSYFPTPIFNPFSTPFRAPFVLVPIESQLSKYSKLFVAGLRNRRHTTKRKLAFLFC